MEANVTKMVDMMNDDTARMFNLTNMTLHDGLMTGNTTGTPCAEQTTDSLLKQVLIWGLSCLALLVLCYATKSTIPDPSHQHGLIARRRRQRRAEANKDRNKRKRLIERSIITKGVIERDKEGNLTLGDVDPDGNSVGEQISYSSTDDEHGSACVVCLEPFRVGDSVSWSKQMECLHVFHHDCILQWLKNPKHDDCPSCRCTIVNPDDVSVDDSVQNENQVEQEGCDDDPEAPSTNIVFVIMNGLVSKARRASFHLIGSSIDADHFRSTRIPPPTALRRVVSEGPASARIQKASIRRSRQGAYAQIATVDSADSAEEVLSTVRRPGLPDDTMSLRTPVSLMRVQSEGSPYDCSRITHDEQPDGLFVAFRRVSSGIYSKLSLTFENTLGEIDDEEDTITEEEESIEWDNEPGSSEGINSNADPELGLRQNQQVIS